MKELKLLPFCCFYDYSKFPLYFFPPKKEINEYEIQKPVLPEDQSKCNYSFLALLGLFPDEKKLSLIPNRMKIEEQLLFDECLLHVQNHC
jgi:hypothetical protein